MNRDVKKLYAEWVEKAVLDPDIRAGLEAIREDDSAIEEAFYRDLEFGTAGLRGVIAAGTNRMNVYTVGKASQGFANYVLAHFPEGARRIAVSYDSRIKSDLFSKTAAGVFAANGIEVYIYRQLMPVPCLSYATRALSCAGGVMITASHNPSKYNGYKVYGPDGCQITTEAADTILGEIEKLDMFSDVKFGDFDALMEAGLIRYVPEYVYDDFIAEVKKQSVLGPEDEIDKNVAIVYTPLNGSGLRPVTRVLSECGYSNITLVEEQKDPDGNFPTCPYPNPEIREAMALGMEYAEKYQAELLMATDPDADRMGIAVRDKDGKYVLITGNENGLLLLDYICAMRTKNGTMPKDPVLVKSVVSTDMADVIAAHYGVRTINVLTGFKFIGEQIAKLEKEGHPESYIFGFEESYGYLSGTYVRDKDAVDAAFLIGEMFSYYKSRGITILEKLNSLYEQYGFYKNTTLSFEYEGIAGQKKMADTIAFFRNGMKALGDWTVEDCVDFKDGINGLPPANILKFFLKDGASIVVRPSGTEPKLKIYISVRGKDREDAALQCANLVGTVKGIMSMI